MRFPRLLLDEPQPLFFWPGNFSGWMNQCYRSIDWQQAEWQYNSRNLFGHYRSCPQVGRFVLRHLDHPYSGLALNQGDITATPMAVRIRSLSMLLIVSLRNTLLRVDSRSITAWWQSSSKLRQFEPGDMCKRSLTSWRRKEWFALAVTKVRGQEIMSLADHCLVQIGGVWDGDSQHGGDKDKISLSYNFSS